MPTVTLLFFAQAQAYESMAPGAYDVITETVMPHLEENLRYARARQTRCLTEAQLSSAFTILGHPSLAGCRLDVEGRNEESASYSLICKGGHGTTGSARWQFGAGRITGALDVKLGGKNMTFSQRVTARRLGECAPQPR